MPPSFTPLSASGPDRVPCSAPQAKLKRMHTCLDIFPHLNSCSGPSSLGGNNVNDPCIDRPCALYRPRIPDGQATRGRTRCAQSRHTDEVCELAGFLYSRVLTRASSHLGHSHDPDIGHLADIIKRQRTSIPSSHTAIPHSYIMFKCYR